MVLFGLQAPFDSRSRSVLRSERVRVHKQDGGKDDVPRQENERVADKISIDAVALVVEGEVLVCFQPVALDQLVLWVPLAGRVGMVWACCSARRKA